MQEGGSDHYNHYQLPSADNELNNGADKWRRPKRDGHKTACDAYKVGESKDQEESGDECAEKWQLRVYKCVRVGVCVCVGAEGRKRRPEAETESLIKRKHFAFWLRASRAKAAS